MKWSCLLIEPVTDEPGLKTRSVTVMKKLTPSWNDEELFPIEYLPHGQVDTGRTETLLPTRERSEEGFFLFRQRLVMRLIVKIVEIGTGESLLF